MPDNKYSDISSGKLYEQIVKQIETRVLNGELQPGDKLPSERDLGKQFGVSRVSIREAIQVLALKGLVEVVHGRGTFVTDQTSEALRHSLNLMVRVGKQESFNNLIEIREFLEPEIASLAASRAKKENIIAMREAISQMDEALENPREYIEADLDFHLALAEATQNPMILILIDILVVELREQRYWASTIMDSIAKSQTYHKQVFKAVEEKNPDAARISMHAHMEQIRKDIQTALKSGKLRAE